MKKTNIIKVILLAVSVAVIVPLWGTFHSYATVERAWVAFISAAVFFAAGHKLKDIVNVALSHILGMFWGMGVLYVMQQHLIDVNAVVYSLIVLAVFGFFSVIVTSLNIKIISHTPSLFAGWAVAFAAFGGAELSEWKDISIDVGLALVIGVVVIGTGISQLHLLLMKLLKVTGEAEEAAEAVPEKKTAAAADKKAAPKAKAAEKAPKPAKSKADLKTESYIASYASDETVEVHNSEYENNIQELKSTINDLRNVLSTRAAAPAGGSGRSYADERVKILGICGSPHKKGSTINYLKKALEAAQEIGNVEVELIELAGKEIHPCMGCKSDKCGGTCRIDDFMQELYPKLRECDGLILASPSYFGTFSGQLKLFLDRLRVMRHSNFELGNKVVGTLAVAGRRHGGQEITNIDLIQSMMRHNTIIVNDGTAVCQLGATGWSHTFDDPSIQSETDDYGMQTAVGVGKRVAEVAKVIKSSGLQNITYQYNQQIGKR
ncbi:NAD(P)H-dependent oxidoreductase [Ruminococcus flavefaciens]|uniref:NAD(P)H-dependent oxidoreductase n=1 Tax=Ruminococcus flavefaciens TaxID=1265 RepID=UPI0002F00C24|nr:NAD(P)H-dependent oxidoreductase [Ruminococcus flavefaciens]